MELSVPEHVELCTWPNPVLEHPSFDVDDFDDKKELVEQMFTIMYEQNGVGLAAPQVGLPFRLFVFDDRSGVRGHIFNPFLRKSTATGYMHEGCLSLPQFYLNDIKRSIKCTITGFDLTGKRIAYTATGLLGQVMQHEMDHLEGVLFFKRSHNPIQTARQMEDWKTVMGL